MGDVADMMLDGTLCQICGVYLEGDAGYPRTCDACHRDSERPAPRTEKVACSVCGRKVSEQGLLDHMRAKHAATETKPKTAADEKAESGLRTQNQGDEHG
jgi:hypothetical protein